MSYEQAQDRAMEVDLLARHIFAETVSRALTPIPSGVARVSAVRANTLAVTALEASITYFTVLESLKIYPDPPKIDEGGLNG